MDCRSCNNCGIVGRDEISCLRGAIISVCTLTALVGAVFIGLRTGGIGNVPFSASISMAGGGAALAVAALFKRTVPFGRTQQQWEAGPWPPITRTAANRVANIPQNMVQISTAGRVQLSSPSGYGCTITYRDGTSQFIFLRHARIGEYITVNPQIVLINIDRDRCIQAYRDQNPRPATTTSA